jgi:hypothetical protein
VGDTGVTRDNKHSRVCAQMRVRAAFLLCPALTEDMQALFLFPYLMRMVSFSL